MNQIQTPRRPWCSVPQNCNDCHKFFVAENFVPVEPGADVRVTEDDEAICAHCGSTAKPLPGVYRHRETSNLAELVSGPRESFTLWLALDQLMQHGLANRDLLKDLRGEVQALADKGASSDEIVQLLEERVPSLWEAIKLHFREDPLGDTAKLVGVVIAILGTLIAAGAIGSKQTPAGAPSTTVQIVQNFYPEQTSSQPAEEQPRNPRGASFFRDARQEPTTAPPRKAGAP